MKILNEEGLDAQTYYKRQLAHAIRNAVAEWFNLDQFGRPSLLDTIDLAISQKMTPTDWDNFPGESASEGRADFIFAQAKEGE